MEYTELKIRLMQHGAFFTKQAIENMCKNKFRQLYFSDYATTSGVVMKINKDIYVNVPQKTESETPFSIDWVDGSFLLKLDDKILPLFIEIKHAARYALENQLLDHKIPVRELVMTHADRMRISPIHGCAHHCLFCTCCKQNYKENPIPDLDQAVEIALKDPNNQPRHILISGGTPKAEKDSYEYLNNVYRYFPNKYRKYEFDVMLSPRGLYAGQDHKQGYKDFLDYLHDECGIQTMSVNLELYNEEHRKKYIKYKWEIGRENYFWFIKKAVAVFGKDKIRSSLVVGIENKKDTLEGVKALIDCGCIPVLSALVPADGTLMQRYPKPEPEFLLEIVHEAAEIARANDTVLGPLCRPCTHNSLTEEVGIIE